LCVSDPGVYAGVKLETLQVCPTFAQFEFSNWNQDGEVGIRLMLKRNITFRKISVGY